MESDDYVYSDMLHDWVQTHPEEITSLTFICGTLYFFFFSHDGFHYKFTLTCQNSTFQAFPGVCKMRAIQNFPNSFYKGVF